MKLNETTRRATDFVSKYGAFRHAISAFMFLPGLRGLWTANHLDTSGNWYDWTKNNLTLTAAGTPGFFYDRLASYVTFDGATDYFTRADEAATSITGTESYIDGSIRGLTLGSWWHSSDATAAQYLLGKATAAAGNYSYGLYFNGAAAGDPTHFWISDDGTNTDQVISGGAWANRWHLSIGRFNDSDTGKELAIFLDGTKTTAATARASIFDGNAAFETGSAQGGLNKLTGGMSINFLCAAALPDDMIGALFQQSRALYGV